MHLCGRQAKVPVARKRLWGRQRRVPEVDGCGGEADVAAEDQGRERGRQAAVDGEARDDGGHEEFVGHGVDDAAYNGLQLPPARDPAVEEVGETRVDEEGEGPEVLVVHDEVAEDGRGEEPGEGQEVGEVPYLFVLEGGELGFEGGAEGGGVRG